MPTYHDSAPGVPNVRNVRASVPWKTAPRKRGSRVTTRLDGAAYWQHHLAARAIPTPEDQTAEALAPVHGISSRVDRLLGVTP